MVGAPVPSPEVPAEPLPQAASSAARSGARVRLEDRTAVMGLLPWMRFTAELAPWAVVARGEGPRGVSEAYFWSAPPGRRLAGRAGGDSAGTFWTPAWLHDTRFLVGFEEQSDGRPLDLARLFAQRRNARGELPQFGRVENLIGRQCQETVHRGSGCRRCYA